MPPVHRIRKGVWTLGLLALCGCASVGPRFSPEIARSFARDDMRRMETDSLVVYYPEHAKGAALRTAARLEKCVEALRGLVLSDTSRRKVVTLITSAEYNNAYVRAQAGGLPTEMVLPLHLGIELFNFFDMGVSEVPDVGCHEAVHYVQMEQTDGLWRWVNLLFGDVLSPNIFTETWFLEGLATWLEGNLGRAQGRPHSPLFRGMFDSGIAHHGGIGGGRLNPADREQLPLGGNYLSGSQFVQWLAETHGQDALWELVDKQGRSVFSPFWVTLRFKAVYGRTIGALLDDYSDHLAATLPRRVRPASQQVLAGDLGYMARLAGSPSDGALAAISAGLDHQSTLTVYESDGRIRFEQKLQRVLPGRPWVLAHPAAISGLSFTADGASLFLLSEDLAADGASTYAVRQFDARTGRFLREWPGLIGLGGAVSPDGGAYVFVELAQDAANLVRLELATGRKERLTELPPGISLGAPAISPDGQRIVFSQRGPEGFDLVLREPDGKLRQLTTDGRFNYSARWLDDDRVLFLREHEERAQAHILEVSTGALRVLTDAAWAVMDPVPAGPGRIAFLNREAWHWTLDAQVLDPASATVLPSPGPSEAILVQATVAAEDPTVATLKVHNDVPYSVFDELFIPRLRVPTVLAISHDGETLDYAYSLSLMGFDRLDFHSWALNAFFDTRTREPSVQLAYGNAQLAPWYLTLALTRAVARDDYLTRPAEGEDPRLLAVGRTRDLVASARASRAFWTSSVGMGFEYLERSERIRPEDGTPDLLQQVRLLGPSLFASWGAGAGTPYAGTQRGLNTTLSATAYPRAFGGDLDLADLRSASTVFVPLPILDRHSFALGVRGRALVGDGARLLRLGGVGPGVTLLERNLETPSPPDVYLPGLAFVESLRGFEDYFFRVNAAAIVSARYRYPLIVDRGTTSFLWLLPSFFVRQLELESFFEGVQTDDAEAPRHAAVGGMVKLRTLWGSVVPLSLFYQYAWRTTPGLGAQHVLGLTVE
jgi:hypothetical protein